jgi:hypothetical protein
MKLVTIEDFVLLSPTTYGIVQFIVTHPRSTYFSCVFNVFTLVENTIYTHIDAEGNAKDAKDAMYSPVEIAQFELPRWLAVIMIRE